MKHIFRTKFPTGYAIENDSFLCVLAGPFTIGSYTRVPGGRQTIMDPLAAPAFRGAGAGADTEE